jgi:hypothetical protein
MSSRMVRRTAAITAVIGEIDRRHLVLGNRYLGTIGDPLDIRPGG